MKNKYAFIAGLLAVIGIIVIAAGIYAGKKNESGNDKIEVVTSFYPMYVLANNLLDGIEDVNLSCLSEPKTGCLHDFQLTPDDMKLLDKADIFIINGSGAENFIDKVISECDNLVIINGTENLDEDEELLMHAWMNPMRYLMEFEDIAQGLIEALPQYKEQIEKNNIAYTKAVGKISVFSSHTPAVTGKSVILFSEAFEPLAKYLSLKVLLVVDLDEEREVSSAEVKEVIDALNANPGAFIMADETYGKKLAETIQNEVDVKVYFIDPLTRGELQDKNYYIDNMAKNLEILDN